MKAETEKKVVLVGTYKGDQLTRWRGWYNWPVSDSDFNAETQSGREGRAGSPLPAAAVGSRVPRDRNCRVVAPRPPKPHGTHYALFKTEFLYRHKNVVPGDAERVIVRTKDFARSPMVRKQLKAYLESPDRNDPDLANRLPSIITRLRPEQLRVCEAAVQLDFWDIPEMKTLKPTVPFPPPKHPKFTFIDLFAGIGGIRLGFQSVGGKCIKEVA